MVGEGDLAAGDIILSIDGKVIDDINTLFSILEQYNFGDRVELRYLRQKKENNVSVILK